MDQGLMGASIEPMADALMPFRHVQQFLVSAFLVYATFDPGHFSLLVLPKH